MAEPKRTVRLLLRLSSLFLLLLWSSDSDLIGWRLELIPGVRMEVIATAASQVQVGAAKSLLRASPANEAATVIIPGGRCLRVTEPLSISRIVGGGGKQRPG